MAIAHDSDVTWQSSYRRLGRTVGAAPSREGAKWPSEPIPKGNTKMLAVCTTLGALGYFTTLVFQQYG